MFNLNDIVNAAQGGQGVNNLGQQFGVSPDQVQSALQSLLPAFSMGMQNATTAPGGLGSIVGQMMNGAHQDAFQNGVSPAGAAAGAGGDVLGQLFGSGDAMQKIAQQAAAASGISPQIIQQMLPVVASMLMGGMFQSMTNQGFGGVLGQLAGAATQSAAGGGAGGGMFGGLIGNMLGGLFGGGQPSAGAANPAAQAGMDALNSMMKAGTAASQGQMQSLQDIFNAATGQKG
ncbi:MAG: DUF937 domain-containing protein [Hyphomicrobiales bacterium]|nr:DUF937 domain-containing protein [Hyphomicrobiales bacterium]MDE2016382.1 DUF937 domain-containing protein [Hyphomicrobiales bacterium]